MRRAALCGRNRQSHLAKIVKVLARTLEQLLKYDPAHADFSLYVTTYNLTSSSAKDHVEEAMLTGTDRRCVVRSCQASAPSSPTMKYRTLVCFDINDFFDKNYQQKLVSESRTLMSHAHKRQLDAALRSMNLLEVAKTILLMMH